MAMPFGVTYWPSGMINQITYANGTTSSYTQTPRLWPATVTTAKTGGATYLNSAYTYDGTGNLATIRSSVDSSFNRNRPVPLRAHGAVHRTHPAPNWRLD